MISNSGHVMTLANSIIGVGILAMPFCFQKCGIILSILLLVVNNWISRISCHYLIKSSLLTRRKSFEFLGFHAFGSSGKLLVELCIIGYLLGTCVTYFVVVGDVGPQIVAKIFSIDGHSDKLRTWIMITVTVICILPLGMLKNVDSLSTLCTASVGFYVCLVIKIILESRAHILANDWIVNVVYWEPAGVLQCLPIFSMALSCQMQLFEVFESINNQSLEKLNLIVKNATWICTGVYISVGFFGYIAFCAQSFSGNVLINFSPSFGSDVIKIGFVLSVAFSFPLVIFPCRASVYSLLYRRGHADASAFIPENRFKSITIFIVTFSLFIALIIPSVELVIGLVGSTIGVAICIIFPALCFRKISKKESTERSFAQIILIGGITLMILGTYANLNAIDEKRSGTILTSYKRALLPTDFPQNIRDLQNDDLKLTNIKKNSLENVGIAKHIPLVNLSQHEKHFQNDTLNNNGAIIPPSAAAPVPQEPKKVFFEKLEISVPHTQSPLVFSKNKDKNNSQIPKKIKFGSLGNQSQSDSNANIVHGKLSKNSAVFTSGIDKEAIKKDEEIAAEEQQPKLLEKKTDELKYARNELKRTKELLERKVDELKEELAKQNKETQELVVEKLGEVVEKVEQIEREVHKKEPGNAASSIDITENKTIGALASAELAQNVKEGNFFSILTEKLQTAEVRQENKENKVYEPLSYKTGEIIINIKNSTKQEDQRLPLPLALLINASQPKHEEAAATLVAAEDPTKEKPLSRPDPLTKPKQIETNIGVANKENIEAIRRDILQLNENKIDITTVQNVASRKKRSVHASLDFEQINAKVESYNCLNGFKIETLMNSNAIELKVHGLGRDLKSIDNKK